MADDAIEIFVLTRKELDDIIYHAAEDGSHQVHYSYLHPNEFPPRQITEWCEEYTANKLKKLKSTLIHPAT